MKKQKLDKPLQEIRFLEDCLLVNNSILVLGDIHIGYEEHIFQDGIFPRVQLKEIFEKLDRVFKNLKEEKISIEKIILLGDLKHEFGGISDSEWRETLQFLDYLGKKVPGKNNLNGSEKIILIKGNHDNILGPILSKRGIKARDYYKIEDLCFAHGNKMFEQCFEKTKILILGHLHPAVTLLDKYKQEKFKCFLKGKWKGKLVYVLPSFSPISFGYDVSSLRQSDESAGFFIVDDKSLKNFEVFVYNHKDKKIYDFGTIKKLIRRQ